MNIVLTLLGVFNTVLAILKQIPETAPLANELQLLENALTATVTAAQKADQQAKLGVDPTQLNTIDPLP